jgi:predicted RNase H-like HicB family nuclease
LEVEVTSQGETLEQARANLAEALALYFEDEADDLGVGEAPIIAPVEVDIGG